MYLIRTILIVSFIFIVGCKAQPKSLGYYYTKNGHVSIGVYSGSVAEEERLYSVLLARGVHADLDGSGFYGIYVSSTQARLAWETLHTNDLVLEHKVHLPINPPK